MHAQTWNGKNKKMVTEPLHEKTNIYTAQARPLKSYFKTMQAETARPHERPSNSSTTLELLKLEQLEIIRRIEKLNLEMLAMVTVDEQSAEESLCNASILTRKLFSRSP
jgi:hypothetical protein